jgi:hypothetical protein
MLESRIGLPGFQARLWAPHASRKLLRLVLALAVTGGAHPMVPADQTAMPGQISRSAASPFGGFGDTDPFEAAKRQRALNAERQKSMVSDTDKLLKLARELNTEVGGENSGSLTSEELHKVAEIEKLARNVKQKMSSAPGGGPALRDPFNPPLR